MNLADRNRMLSEMSAHAAGQGDARKATWLLNCAAVGQFSSQFNGVEKREEVSSVELGTGHHRFELRPLVYLERASGICARIYSTCRLEIAA